MAPLGKGARLSGGSPVFARQGERLAERQGRPSRGGVIRRKGGNITGQMNRNRICKDPRDIVTLLADKGCTKVL